MARVQSISISGYRSVGEELFLKFPSSVPLVLIGENNAGKTNIARALDLVLGESYPGNYEPDDHEFFGRDKRRGKIVIDVGVSGMKHAYRNTSETVETVRWQWPAPEFAFSLRIKLRDSGWSPYGVPNATREQCVCVYVATDRRLSYQLSYTTKFTFLSKLMKRFHDRLMNDEARAAKLRETFSELRATFDQVPEFHAFQARLDELTAALTGGQKFALNIDFSAYDPSNYFHALRIHPREGGEVRTLAELGSGQEQLLALAFVQAYAEAFHGDGGLILVLDEPEANLHPLAQRWLARRLRELAKGGQVQVVLTTHSPAFLDMEGLEGIVLVTKDGSGCTVANQLTVEELVSHCISLSAPAGKLTAENILEHYSAAASEPILSGFFARTVVLVEGSSESLSLPLYFQRLGFDTTKAGTDIISVEGVGNLAKWYRLFTAYGIPTYVIFDNDKTDQGAVRRTDVLSTLGIPPTGHDAYLAAETLVVESGFAVFGRDFESCLASYFESYGALDEEAQVSVGGSKPLRARFIARKLELTPGPGRDALANLTAAIQSLSREATAS